MSDQFRGGKLWVLLPVKQFSSAKSRLRAALLDRYGISSEVLAEAMLRDVVSVLLRAPSIDGIALVSSEPQLASLTSQRVLLIEENQQADLNQSLRVGIETLKERGVSHCLILPSDIPLISVADIEQITQTYLHTVAEQQRLVIALCSDYSEEGTNLLCFNIQQPFSTVFGQNSFQRHLQLATSHNIDTVLVENEAISFDIDRAFDVERLIARLADSKQASTTKVVTETSALFADAIAKHDSLPDKAKLNLWLNNHSDQQLTAKAQQLRDQYDDRLITYSKKVFIPLTRLCRDVCHYCTFATTPRQLPKPYLSSAEVLAIARQGAEAGCQEALLTLGEKPELRYRVAKQFLDEMGFASTLEYVAHIAQLILEETGLLPHINAGCMTLDEIQMLRPVSASMGIMLENSSPRLCEKGMPHYGSPDKQPQQRLETLRNAGKLGVPMTTGILIGIGETREERIDSLLAIRAVHQQYGHIQEIIIQNFVPKTDTKMAGVAPATLAELCWTISVARLIFGSTMSIQAPPNLNTGHLNKLIEAGINDWGGVSPLTPDHVNPESPWPQLNVLAEYCRQSNKTLQGRLTIYPSYLIDSDQWLDAAVLPYALKHADSQGFARENDWLSGVSDTVPENFPKRKVKKNRQISSALAKAISKIQTDNALSSDEIVTLFSARGDDFDYVCEQADQLRQRESGDAVTHVVNRNINYTNICTYSCNFCAFSKGKKHRDGADKPYLKTIDEIVCLANEAVDAGATEVCLQGGIHPQFTGKTYLDICAAVHEAQPDLHIHAFSPLEIRHGADTLGLSVREFLQQLTAVGLNTLPGTAAEILCDDVRALICPDKLNSEEWLSIIETAHEVGLRTTATIMFGHVDQYAHWASHLLKIKQLQQQTNGFTEFVPLPFVANEAPLYRRGQSRRGPTWREAVLMHAVARLVLYPDIANIQTSWVKMGVEGAKYCLQSGANDLGGVLMNESITRAAGARHGQYLQKHFIENAVLELGRYPQQRNTLYQNIGDSCVGHSEIIQPQTNYIAVEI